MNYYNHLMKFNAEQERVKKQQLEHQQVEEFQRMHQRMLFDQLIRSNQARSLVSEYSELNCRINCIDNGLYQY